MFIYGSRLPENPTFARSIDDVRRNDRAADDLWNASREIARYRDNSNAESTAMSEAYERRNRAIFEATGRQLDNPYRLGWTSEERARIHRGGRAADAIDLRRQAETKWQAELRKLSREQPEHAAVIGADRPISEDAYAIARGAEADFARASEAASDLPFLRRFGNSLGGGISGALRDPLQVATLLIGGGAGTGRLVVGRILQVMLTEAAVNAGVETAVIAAGQDWRRRAGLESSTAQTLTQIGLAGLFGAGFGGLLQGGREVFRALGKSAPDALERVAAGDMQPGDLDEVAGALGVPLDDKTRRTAALAAEQRALDEEAFGPPPEGMAASEARRLANDTLRAAEDPPEAPLPPGWDRQERREMIDLIVRDAFPVGRAPRKPQSLIQFLAGNGGLLDDGGELAHMGLGRHFVPGYGQLVRRSGRHLDMAREAAAEAGFLDKEFGSAETAVARSTVADLLKAIDEERSGQPRYSAQEDGAVIEAHAAYEARVAARNEFRRLVDDIDGAVDELGIEHALDRKVIARAAEFSARDGDDPVVALERALEEDYRMALDAPDVRETGIADDDDFDIPFFEEDARAGQQAGGAPGALRADGEAGSGGTDAPPGGQFSRPGVGEGQAPGLKAAGATPEPATTEAADIADLALTEARRASEQTAAGEQTLIEGVEPVSTRERLEAQGDKPMRGGDQPPPEGGLFDLDARDQLDIWDAMPAAKKADGDTLFTTHADMIADAERDDFLGDLIASCR